MMVLSVGVTLEETARWERLPTIARQLLCDQGVNVTKCFQASGRPASEHSIKRDRRCKEFWIISKKH